MHRGWAAKSLVCGNLCMQVLPRCDREHRWEHFFRGFSGAAPVGEVVGVLCEPMDSACWLSTPFMWQSGNSLGVYKAFVSLYVLCLRLCAHAKM